MNFLLHRRLAARDLGGAVAGAGAMLPDLWRMADRRVRARAGVVAPPSGGALREVLAGIEHHLEADAWFHRAAVFVEGERRLAEGFRRAGVTAPRMGLFAHIAWELCLDGALVRHDGVDATLAALRPGLTASATPGERAADLHHFDEAARSPVERDAFRARMAGITERLVAGAWVAAYADEDGVAEVLGAIRRRLGLPGLDADDRARTASALRALRDTADTAVAELLARGP